MSNARRPVVSTVFALAAGLILSIGPGSAVADEGDFSGTPKVRITGRATETHPRDRAVVRLKVAVRENDVEKVTAVLAEKSSRLVALLHERGFGDAELSTWGPKCDEVWRIDRAPNGVETARTKLGVDGAWGVRIGLDGIDRPTGRARLAAFVTAAGLGGASVDQMTFDVADHDAILARLDRSAAENAMDKARELIRATGAKPGRLLGLTDTRHRQEYENADLARAQPSALKTIPILPGDETIEATVEVVVEILTP